MTTQQLQVLILIIMFANAALIVVALVTMRRSRSHGGDQAELNHVATRETMLAMSMTGAGAGPLPSAPKRDSGSEPAGPTLIESTATLATATPADDPPDDETSEGSIALVDPSTGLESPAAWRRAVDEEVVRLARYHRTATVMLIELDGFERLTARLGEPAGARLVLATARTLHAQTRAADRCARFGRGRFAILMPETDEIEAINFAERVRAECDRWLEAGEVATRVVVGWATLDPDQGSGPAILEAEHRLDTERRQRAGSAA